MNISILKSKAKEQLKGRWKLAIITVLVSNLFINADLIKVYVNMFSDTSKSFSFSLNLFSLLFGGVIYVGLNRFLLNFITNENTPKFKDLFSHFNIFFKILCLYIVMGIVILLASLLLLIPGIIVALMYSQVFYILAEDPNKGIMECLKESSNLMYGYKWKFFVLELSFIGWWIVASLTLGIGGLWVEPYQKVTETNFYLKLKYNV